jgi:hypothetical protein
MSDLTFIRFFYYLKYLIDLESEGRLKNYQKLVKDASNLASFYGSQIDRSICVKQIGLGLKQW